MSKSSQFDAYHELLGIPPAEQPPNLYRLVGISLFENVHSVIERAADRQMSHLRSFQVGKHAVDSQKLLNELARARHILLDDAERAAYDAKLRKQLEPKAAPKPAPAAAPKPAAAKPTPVARPQQPAPVQPRPQVQQPLPQQPPAPQYPVYPELSAPASAFHSHTLGPAHGGNDSIMSPALVAAIVAGVVVSLGIIVLFVSQMGGSTPPVPVAIAPDVPAPPNLQPTIPQPPLHQVPGPPHPTIPPAAVPREMTPDPFVVPPASEPPPTPTTPESEPTEPVSEPVLESKREPLESHTWIELIPLVEFDHDLASGEWTRNGNQLSVTGIRNSRLRFPVILTNCSYDFETEFKLGVDHDDIHLIIPVGDQNVLVSTDSYGNRKYSYLDRVAGKEAWENPAAVVANLLQPNTLHRIKMSVRLTGDHAQVAYTLDGKQRYMYEGPTSDLQVAPAWSIGTKAQPALAIYDTPATFTTCRVKLLEGEGFYGRAAPLLQPIPERYAEMRATSLTSLTPAIKTHFEDKFGINAGTNPIINGQPCTDFVYAHAPSRLTYAIPPGTKAFTAMAYCARSGSVKFIVSADGQELYSVERRAIAPVAVNIPEGAKTLTLECDPLDRSWDDDSCWCFPAFRE
ncbi:NPCBM/NEW2 domain-containing protein [Anatilimnocola floriformis]|uniref:NPCBM/NEW2 domain-containing protein n=1 Tax=Anatilimnocola floriformis TaxID=2948575 RepID=UPI0020C3EDA1|nr:NPCBM/NEW2 domain-containing protein [Anatilimnocola floriformis]